MKIKKLSLYVLVGFIILSFLIPNFINNIRYKIESTFGNPNSFFYSVGIGIEKTKNEKIYYDEDYDLDDIDELTIKKSQFNDAEIRIYGKVTNSADPLTVILNDKVIYKGNMSNSNVDSFWKKFYLNKFFVVKLSNLKVNEVNEIILTSGNAVEKFKVKIQ